MKLINRRSTAVAAALIVLVAAATMASGHTVAPTTTASLALHSSRNKVIASGTYNPNNPECQQSGLSVSIKFYSGTTLVDTKSATTGIGGVIPATNSKILPSGTYTVTVTVTGVLLGGYDATHTCPNGTATSNAVTIP